jgi:transposase
MRRHEISDDNWSRIEHLLPGRPGGHGGVARDNRGFINAVWYVAKTGIPWRDLPDRFGKWDTVFHRFNAWCKKGVWARVFEAVRDPDLEWLMIDSTVIRAHHHAAGMNGGDDDQALGRSRGGFGTKIHLSVDSLGLPVEVHLSPGQDADVTHAETLLGDHRPEAVLGDKGYDSDAFAKVVGDRGAEVVIPPRSNRKTPREYDAVVYKERNKVERCINRLKQFRRVATRYEKTARNFLGMALFAAITLWLQ